MAEHSTADKTTEQAAGELARLTGQVEAMRAVLIRLLQDVVQTESRLDNNQAALLVEANERLVVASMRSQTDADTASQALSQASRAAELDALTQLPNRMLLLDRFAHAISMARRQGAPVAILFIDLNDFKRVNDSLGHAVGDEVLKSMARSLAAVVREVDTVSRHGGDEFLILLTQVSQASDAVRVADKVIVALGVPKRFGDHVLRLSASIGIAVFPQDGEDPQTLIDRADAAMYRAKALGPASSVALAGQPPAVRDTGLRLKSLQQPLSHYERAMAQRDERYAQLQEANEQLVLAALDAQELHAAAEQAHRRQTEFLAVIAHELRNPLAPIRLAASIIGRVKSDEPLLPRATAIIERQVTQITRLVNDLVDVSRVNTGKLNVDFGVVDLVEAIDDAIDACRPAMDIRLQSLQVSAPSRALTLSGDHVRLTQVFSNLLNNASKFTNDGGNLRLSITVSDSNACVTLSDNGIGIAPEALDDIFEPFFQDSHAIGFNGVGLGVGLTVVRHLVAAHGGTVVASSAGRGQGASFVVTLPLLPDGERTA